MNLLLRLCNKLLFCSENTQAAFAINPLEEVVNERLRQITGGDMPAVVIDATGNLQAINTAFQYMAHGGRYVLVGLQKGDISFSHPEFHKKEGTLMSSRNATRADFEHVINSIRNGLVHPANYITHRVSFGQVKDTFPSWLNPDSLVIKAMTDC